MKKTYLSILSFVLFFSMIACKKERNPLGDSIQGTWELRRISGMITTQYPAMNGHTIRFSGNHYEFALNGQVTQSGEYEIVSDLDVSQSVCLVFPTGQYSNRIVYDNNSAAQKVFLQLSGDALTFVSGCFAFDGGSFSDYVRL